MAVNQFGVRLFTETETPDIKKTAINKCNIKKKSAVPFPGILPILCLCCSRHLYVY